MRVLVTGHNGYVGSVMVPVLSAFGHSVVGLDTFFFEECSLLADPNPVAAVRKDVRNLRVADLKGVDAVIHLAGIAAGRNADAYARAIPEINHRGAVHVAECARAAGVRRFLFLSTCAVYGVGVGDETVTEEAPVKPVTADAIAKARAEEEILRLADGAFSPAVMRSAVAYGVSPRLRADHGLNHLVCWAHATGRACIDRDATLWQPLVHVQDIAYALAAALVAPRAPLHGQIFNLGANSENYQIAELAEIVRGAVVGCIVESISGLEPTAPGCRVDFGKLSRTLPDFRPQWNASFGAKDLSSALQDGNVMLEDFQGRRFNRAAQLRHLQAGGGLDDRLHWRRTALADPQA
jgi:nucleoside-diphosphate-sugar epimerase